MKSLDPMDMLRAGRVTVLDVSAANDTVKNLVTADLLRKTFAYKIARAGAPPTLLVIDLYRRPFRLTHTTAEAMSWSGTGNA